MLKLKNGSNIFGFLFVFSAITLCSCSSPATMSLYYLRESGVEVDNSTRTTEYYSMYGNIVNGNTVTFSVETKNKSIKLFFESLYIIKDSFSDESEYSYSSERFFPIQKTLNGEETNFNYLQLEESILNTITFVYEEEVFTTYLTDTERYFIMFTITDSSGITFIFAKENATF